MDYDLVLFLLVCLSCLAGLAVMWTRVRLAAPGWLVVYLAISLLSVIGWFGEQPAIFHTAAALWFVLVVLPGVIGKLCQRRVMQQQYSAARRLRGSTVGSMGMVMLFGSGPDGMQLTVGASGCIMGLVGADGALMPARLAAGKGARRQTPVDRDARDRGDAKPVRFRGPARQHDRAFVGRLDRLCSHPGFARPAETSGAATTGLEIVGRLA